MKNGTFVIGNKLGIHARPAAQIAKMVAKYNCEAKLEANGKVVDATSVLMVISMGAKKGTELKLNIEGEDEDKLFEELSEYIGSNFYEE